MEDQQTSSRKTLFIVGGIILILLIGVALFLFLQRDNGNASKTSIASLFGNLGSETLRPTGVDIQAGTPLTDGSGFEDNQLEEPLFRQLANIPTAGATAISRNGSVFVRYVAKENAHTYEVDPRTGKVTQLTNTTIPRIYEAYWGNEGNSVVLRYLTHDILKQDRIKTYLAYLNLPNNSESSTASSSTTLGTLVGDFLPDNISALSISPDGTKLFYLLPVEDGVSGTTITIATKSAKEVLRSSFSEWLPQLLDNGTIILTTKASAKTAGFSYLYNPENHSFSRILRNVDGMTTLGNKTGERVLYNKNTAGKIALNIYSSKGYEGDEGLIFHSVPIPLTTLPEKCVWAKNQIRLFCGSFASSPNEDIPDVWYQGVFIFADTFWTMNTDDSEITFLSDPTKDGSANQSFDVSQPFIGDDETHFFFTNKTDSTLWSMRILKEKFLTIEETVNPQINTPQLTPDELKDAVGSNSTTKPSLKK